MQTKFQFYSDTVIIQTTIKSHKKTPNIFQQKYTLHDNPGGTDDSIVTLPQFKATPNS